jgi:phosphohistidine phosphatase SixA
MLSLLPALLLALAPQAPVDTLDPPTVVVVRHAEKVDASRDPALSDAGRARAMALDSALADARVTAIIVTPYRRNAETAAPVAARHGLTPIVVPVSGEVDAHAAAVAAEALRHHGTVLVVGHSNTVGAVVAALGGTATIGDLCESAYQWMFMVRPTPTSDGAAMTVRTRYGAADPPAAAGCSGMAPQ